MFAKTSLLNFLTSHPILRCELCFLRRLFSSVFRVVMCYGDNLPNPGLHGARPLWSGASKKFRLCLRLYSVSKRSGFNVLWLRISVSTLLKKILAKATVMFVPMASFPGVKLE